MKTTIIAIAALLLGSCAVHAAPYGGLRWEYDSVSLNAPSSATLPGGLSGYNADLGWSFGRIAIGGQYSNTSGAKNGNNLSADRYGAEASYHFVAFPGIDSYVTGDVGRSSYKASVSTFTPPATVVRSQAFAGQETDFSAGLGSTIPVWRSLAIDVNGRYRTSGFGGHANSDLVLGIGLVVRP